MTLGIYHGALLGLAIGMLGLLCGCACDRSSIDTAVVDIPAGARKPREPKVAPPPDGFFFITQNTQRGK